ncbi:hypothetical protein SAMN04487991_3535 [Celeribacter neptunius]|uniref:Uncharacterized protein n=1 Tax=Celeribacter neptunius TaxID=588602 RepID=A0A1I3W1Z9_9RHOB|nr:hypothetical protein SAMN04487991_3535 [Celeribacter neptunius]
MPKFRHMRDLVGGIQPSHSEVETGRRVTLIKAPPARRPASPLVGYTGFATVLIYTGFATVLIYTGFASGTGLKPSSTPPLRRTASGLPDPVWA